jgi:hypothetical protein
MSVSVTLDDPNLTPAQLHGDRASSADPAIEEPNEQLAWLPIVAGHKAQT